MMQSDSGSLSSRPSYLSSIDIALKDRKDLLSALHAVCKENPSIARLESVKKLQRALGEGVDAESFLADPQLVCWLSLIVAEHTDEGDSRLTILAEQLKSIDRRSRLNWFAFVYPLILTLILIAVLVLLSLTVIPIFSKMFREFELKLPTPTFMVFKFAHFITNQPYQFITAVLLSLIAAVVCVRLSGRLLQVLELAKPIGFFTAGSKSNRAAMARFADTFSAAIRIGMPKEDAMDVAGIASHRFQYRLRASQLARELRNGEDVLQGSRVAHVFPPMLLSAAKVGTNDQPNVRVLEQIAALYRSRSSSAQSWLDQGLGPLFVVALGGLVGFIVIALFMPLVSLVTSLSGAS